MSHLLMFVLLCFLSVNNKSSKIIWNSYFEIKRHQILRVFFWIFSVWIEDYNIKGKLGGNFIIILLFCEQTPFGLSFKNSASIYPLSLLFFFLSLKFLIQIWSIHTHTFMRILPKNTFLFDFILSSFSHIFEVPVCPSIFWEHIFFFQRY